jgi:hypothetical protein
MTLQELIDKLNEFGPKHKSMPIAQYNDYYGQLTIKDVDFTENRGQLVLSFDTES